MLIPLFKKENHYLKFSFSLSKHDKSFSFTINSFKPNLILSLFRVLVDNFMVII